LILFLFDQNIPSRKNFKEQKHSRILTCVFFLILLAVYVYILEVNLVKTTLCLFKNKSFQLIKSKLRHVWELWYGLKRLEMLTKFSSEYLKGNRKLGRSNRTRKNSTKMNIRTAGHFDVRWICPTQKSVQ